MECEKCGITSDQVRIVDRWDVDDVSRWPKYYTQLCIKCFKKVTENE